MSDRICFECKHCFKDALPFPACMHQKVSRVNLVDGIKSKVDCQQARYGNPEIGNLCGIEGKYWEPRND